MINAEGMRGHQYADKFKYVTCDLNAPYRPVHYTESLKAAASLRPAVVIIDSVSHMHDGPGGVLEWHEEELDRMAGQDFSKRDKCNMSAWIKPKADENKFIYQMLSMKCPVILCLRAKEKVKIVTGKPIIDLGWQPIVGERIAFETIFTLMMVPHAKGVPSLELSDMREPFDVLVPKGKQIDEQLGEQLAKWAAGGTDKAAEDNGLSDEKSLTYGLQSQDAPLPQSLMPAYLDQIALSQSVAECSKTLNTALKDTTLSVFETTQLQEAGKKKIVSLRATKS